MQKFPRGPDQLKNWMWYSAQPLFLLVKNPPLKKQLECFLIANLMRPIKNLLQEYAWVNVKYGWNLPVPNTNRQYSTPLFSKLTLRHKLTTNCSMDKVIITLSIIGTGTYRDV